MNTCQWPGAGKNIVDGVRYGEELFLGSHDAGGSNRPGKVHGAAQQRTTTKFKERFVPSHALATPAGQNERCDITHAVIIHIPEAFLSDFLNASHTPHWSCRYHASG